MPLRQYSSPRLDIFDWIPLGDIIVFDCDYDVQMELGVVWTCSGFMAAGTHTPLLTPLVYEEHPGKEDAKGTEVLSRSSPGLSLGLLDSNVAER